MECNIDIDISSDIAWFKLIYYNIKANGEFPLTSTSTYLNHLQILKRLGLTPSLFCLQHTLQHT